MTHEPSKVVKARGVVLDARAPGGKNDAQHLSDREQVDVLAIDKHVEQVVHDAREEVALVQPEHVGAELRVLDAPPRAMHRAVGDAHDPAADVAVFVRALVEAARQIRIEQRRSDVLVPIELDHDRVVGQ